MAARFGRVLRVNVGGLAGKHVRDTPTPDWLDRLAELRVPARLADEWARLTGVGLALVDAAGGRGRTLAPVDAGACFGRGQPRWPECLEEPSGLAGARVPCAAGHGDHLVQPVLRRGVRAAALVSDVLPASPPYTAERLGLSERCLFVIADEMSRFLDREPSIDPGERDFPELIGGEPAFVELRAEMRRALQVGYPVLVTGETGTGKDLVAWLLHHRGARAARPFVTLNCAALPDDLLESELFGHRRGAFTGADRDKPGLFASALDGTLFLDEIQQLSLGAQAKLLRVVESGEYLALGSVKTERSRARLVTATNASLEALVANGGFRKDLFYRLSVLTLRTPALASVREDLPGLVEHFMRLVAAREGLPPRTVSREAMAALIAAQWPGNVRQLIHEVERALLRCGGGEVQPAHLSPELRPLAPTGLKFPDMGRHLAESWEREEIRHGLERTGWNVSRLAQELGLSRTGLTQKIARYGLRRPEA